MHHERVGLLRRIPSRRTSISCRTKRSKPSTSGEQQILMVCSASQILLSNCLATLVHASRCLSCFSYRTCLKSSVLHRQRIRALCRHGKGRLTNQAGPRLYSHLERLSAALRRSRAASRLWAAETCRIACPLTLWGFQEPERRPFHVPISALDTRMRSLCEAVLSGVIP